MNTKDVNDLSKVVQPELKFLKITSSATVFFLSTVVSFCHIILKIVDHKTSRLLSENTNLAMFIICVLFLCVLFYLYIILQYMLFLKHRDL